MELAALERLKKSPPRLLMVLMRTIVALWATYLLLAPKNEQKLAGVRSQLIVACSCIGAKKTKFWGSGVRVIDLCPGSGCCWCPIQCILCLFLYLVFGWLIDS